MWIIGSNLQWLSPDSTQGTTSEILTLRCGIEVRTALTQESSCLIPITGLHLTTFVP